MENKWKIYEALANIMKGINPVDKGGYNPNQKYKFRGVDQIMNELHKLLAENGVIIITETVSHEQNTRPSNDKVWVTTIQKINYHLVASDGSEVVATIYGEGADTGDKSTNKSLAAAYKYMLMHTFCIPFEDAKKDDPDNYSPDFCNPEYLAIFDKIAACTSQQDVHNIYNSYAPMYGKDEGFRSALKAKQESLKVINGKEDEK